MIGEAAGLDRRLQSYIDLRNLEAVRVGALVAFSLMLAAIAMDFDLYPDEYASFVPARLASAFLSLGILAASYFPWAPRHAFALALAISVICAVGINLIVLQPGGYPDDYHGAMGQIMLIWSVIFIWRPHQLLLGCALVTTLWMIPTAIWAKELHFGGLQFGGYGLAMFTAMSVAAGTSRYRWIKRGYRARLERETLANKVEAANQERIEWLGRVATFLGHELKNQIVGVSTSLDLLEQTHPRTHASPYLERARLSVGRIHGLINSATEATDLESALHTEGMEPIDLSALVIERGRSFQDVFSRGIVQLEIAPRITIPGNDLRLAQLIDKFLTNAAEHVSPNGSIRIALSSAEDHAVLRIENEGDPLPKDLSHIFDPFVSTKASRSGRENLGIGLYVADVIARSHHGTIRSGNLKGDGGAFFEILLPLVHPNKPKKQHQDRAA